MVVILEVGSTLVSLEHMSAIIATYKIPLVVMGNDRKMFFGEKTSSTDEENNCK